LRIAVSDQRPASGGARAPRIAVADRAGTLPGRGAYLCRAGDAHAGAVADPSCLERATRRGGIARALRSAVTLDPKLVESVNHE
jgi:predicted RNA-binding protein YlxR (DUF448 family)